MGLMAPVATALDTGQFGIANVNLHFYWVFGQSNICCGEFWSRPQYVVDPRRLGASEERESPSGSRRVADPRSTFALSPQSVAIMSGSVNRRGCGWARGFSEDGGGPTRGLQQSPEYPADAHSGVGCNQGFFTGAYNELQEPGETFVGLHRSLVKWT